MTIFDLVFIVVFFTVLITLIAAAVAAGSKRYGRALWFLRGLGIFIAAYLTVVIIVSLATPPRLLQLNEPQCSDDWCITVSDATRTSAGADVLYTVTLRLSSRARGRPQRENGVSVYLLDERGRRYEPQADPQAVPFNVLLQPGEAINTTRQFTLPATARNPGLVVAHGKFPGIFIIADEQSLFHKPTVVQLE